MMGVKLGWPKCSLEFFCNIVWRNLNELFGQPNTYMFSRPVVSDS